MITLRRCICPFEFAAAPNAKTPVKTHRFSFTGGSSFAIVFFEAGSSITVTLSEFNDALLDSVESNKVNIRMHRHLKSEEVTLEDPGFPVESALRLGGGPGWRASQKAHSRSG